MAETEQRILRAARELFMRNGYHATTLTEVADAAGVGHRTVYLRFGTKAALLKRVTDIAVAGDPGPLDVAQRDWFQAALSAPTLEERIDALARGTADLMHRADGLVSHPDQEWLRETVALVGQADTYLLLRRTTRWTLGDYRGWLITTLRHLFAGDT